MNNGLTTQSELILKPSIPILIILEFTPIALGSILGVFLRHLSHPYQPIDWFTILLPPIIGTVLISPALWKHATITLSCDSLTGPTDKGFFRRHITGFLHDLNRERSIQVSRYQRVIGFRHIHFFSYDDDRVYIQLILYRRDELVELFRRLQISRAIDET